MKKIICVISVMLLVAASLHGKPEMYGVKVIKEYPHDVSSYTQGLFFHNGELFESTGQWGKSTFRKVDLNSGKSLRRLDFDKKYFVEGSSILGDELFILTWTDKVVFVYDAKDLTYKKTYRYPRQGWGLTNNGKCLIASDGSSKLYFMDCNLKVQKTLNVSFQGRAVSNLNELEWIDGKIWANVYLSDIIYIINPDSGNVEAVVSCAGLLPKKLRSTDTDVLNGIAYDAVNKKIYLTGKNWPRLYEVVPVKSGK